MKIQSSQQNSFNLTSPDSKKGLNTSTQSPFEKALDGRSKESSLKEFSPTVYASIEIDIPNLFAKKFS